PTKRHQSQAVRHRPSFTLFRYLKPTGRKNKANSTSSIATYRPENDAAYTSGHAAKITPPAITSQVWLPSKFGSIERRIMRRSSSDLPRKGDSMPMPRSHPSVNANTMMRPPTKHHQITLSVA